MPTLQELLGSLGGLGANRQMPQMPVNAQTPPFMPPQQAAPPMAPPAPQGPDPFAMLMSLGQQQAQPEAPKTKRQQIGMAIGDFLQSIGAGLSNRGKAGQSTGAGAAMQTPFILQQQRQQQAQQQQMMQQAQQKQRYDQMLQGINARMMQQKLGVEQQQEQRLAQQPRPIDPLSPQGITARGQQEAAIQAQRPVAPVKPPDLTPEERFIDLGLKEAVAANKGLPLSASQEKTERGKLKGEWLSAGKDPELGDLNLRIKELQVQAAEDRLDRSRESGLSPSQQTQVLRIGSGFDNAPIVKRYNVVTEGLQFVKTMDPKTTNPVDHIAMIYALAKILDPESVVREGEYATIKKYAQSWREQFGMDALRVVDNQGILSADAMAKVQKTIASRGIPVMQQYENLRKETTRKINVVTGRNDGANYLIDFSGAFDAAPSGSGGSSVDEAMRILNGP